MKTIKEVLYSGTKKENDKSPFIIAEMSGNHGASLQGALNLIDEISKTGVDAVKLQTFTPDSMTMDIGRKEFVVSNKKSLWYGRKLYDLYKEAQTKYEWHKEIFDRAKEKGLLCFSTPFDENAVDLLESLGAPAYKIASFECVDIPLIKYVAQTGKPMIISTGMASLAEIELAVKAALENGCSQLTILKCTSSYPAPASDMNLKTIPHMKELFGCQVGLSDHTLGIGAAVAATTLGATVIEKHFKLEGDNESIDSAFSLTPNEFKQLVTESKVASEALGKIVYGTSDSDTLARKNRRSIYFCKDVKKGDVISAQNIRRVRPGHGMAPKFYDDILGMTITKDAFKGDPLTWSSISNEY